MENKDILFANDLVRQWNDVMSNAIDCKLPTEGILKLMMSDSETYVLIKIDDKKKVTKSILYDKDVWNYIVNVKFKENEKKIRFGWHDDISECYTIALDESSKARVREINKCLEYLTYTYDFQN